MKQSLFVLVLASLGLATVTTGVQASEPGGAEINSAVGTAFAYQGQLKLNGQPVPGPTDFQFFLYDGLSAGAQVGPTLSFSNAVGVEVTEVAGRLVRVLKPGSIHTQKIVRVEVGK